MNVIITGSSVERHLLSHSSKTSLQCLQKLRTSPTISFRQCGHLVGSKVSVGCMSEGTQNKYINFTILTTI
jgi:hypothetical protein